MAKTRIGFVGLGRFGQFLLDSFSDQKIVEITAICDPDEKTVSEVGAKYNIYRKYTDYKLMVRDPLVDMVVIATPPFLHYPVGYAALFHGKHIWLEKPPTLAVSELDTLIALARKKKLKAFVDFELRYSPFWQALMSIQKDRLLSDCQSFAFENFASDAGLPPEHWFWDKKKSGGIFVEHNIHFFDIFSQIFGRGNLSLAKSFRRSKGVEDKVFAAVIYDDKVWANVTHSFSMPSLLERTTARFTFLRGHIQINGWIPTSLEGECLLTKNGLEKLKKIIPLSALTIERNLAKNTFRGNWKMIEAHAKVKINWRSNADKQNVYAGLVKSVLADAIRAVNDRKFDGAIELDQARPALKLAETANKAAAVIKLKQGE